MTDIEPGDRVVWTSSDGRLCSGTYRRPVARSGLSDALIRLDVPEFREGEGLCDWLVLPFSALRLLRAASVYERLALIEEESK